MAKPTPIIENPGVKPRPIGTPYVDTRVSPASLNVLGAARGMVDLAQAAAQHVDRERAKAKDYAAADLDMKASREIGNLLYDPKSGFMLQKEANALDSKPVMDKVDEILTKYADGTKDPDVRGEFQRRMALRVESVRRDIERHAGEQTRMYYAGVTNGVLAEQQNQARLHYTDLQQAGADVNKGVERLIIHLADEGKDEGSIRTAVQKYRATSFDKVINEYFSRDDGIGGLKALNTPGVREMLGDAAADWQRKLIPIARAQQAEVLAEQLFQASFGADPDLPKDAPSVDIANMKLLDIKKELDAPEARAAGRDPLHPEVYAAVQEKLAKKFNLWKAGYNIDSDQIFNAASSFWERGGHDLSAVPLNLKQRLIDRGEWHKLESADKAYKAGRDGGDPPTPTQRQAMAKFVLDLATTPHAFNAWTPERYQREMWGKLHPTDYEQGALALARVQGRPDKLTAGLEPIMAMFTRLGGSDEFKVFPNLHDTARPENRSMENWKPAQVDAFYEGQRQIQEWLANWHKEDRQGKPAVPTQEEYEVVVRRVLAKGLTPGKYYGHNEITRLQAQVAGVPFLGGAKTVDDVPFAMRDTIKRDYKKHLNVTQDPTDPEIVNIYNRLISITPPPKPQPKVDIGPVQPIPDHITGWE